MRWYASIFGLIRGGVGIMAVHQWCDTQNFLGEKIWPLLLIRVSVPVAANASMFARVIPFLFKIRYASLMKVLAPIVVPVLTCARLVPCRCDESI